MVNFENDTAIIVVDVQNDFSEEGTLPVEGTKDLAKEIEALLNKYKTMFKAIVFTRDWHPKDHPSFKENGGKWPKHCVQGTWGAGFVPPLDKFVKENRVLIIDKAMFNNDGYSAFEGTNLDHFLRYIGVNKIIVVGVASDYCVRATAIDAKNLGFEVELWAPFTRGVWIETDPESLRKELEDQGIKVIDNFKKIEKVKQR